MNNKLNKLPPTIGDLKALRVLYLADNQLNTLPPTIGNMKNLMKLSIVGNPLNKLPAAIINLTSLNEITLNKYMMNLSKEWIRKLKELGVFFLIADLNR